MGTHEDAPYVVMELLGGETRRARLSAGPLPVRKAIDYAAQMAQGLAGPHAKGIVHRDLEPENLLVGKDGWVKMLDFGLAKLTRPEALAGVWLQSLVLAQRSLGYANNYVRTLDAAYVVEGLR